MGKKDRIDVSENIDTSEYLGKKVIVFDLYGTCIHRPDWFFGWEKLSLYREIRRDVARSLGKRTDKSIKEVSAKLRDVLQTQHVDINKPIDVGDWIKISLSEKLIKKINEDIAWILVYDDFFSLVKKLKKEWYIIVVVSNLAEVYAAPLMDQLKWVFHHKVLSYEVWFKKPSPEIFKIVNEMVWNVGYDQMIIIGDRLDKDIIWPSQQWLKAIHVNRHKTHMEFKQDKETWVTYLQVWTLKHVEKALNLKNEEDVEDLN